MRFLLLNWNAMGNEYVIKNLRNLGHTVELIPFEEKSVGEDELIDLFRKYNSIQTLDGIFSFNYFPMVSNACQNLGIPYLSWVYDSPYINIYSYTVLNSCNHIFLFDYGVYNELSSNGINTVHYLPLGVDRSLFDNFDCTEDERKHYSSDISFVGSLYNEDKNNLYAKFDGIDDYSRGFLEALINSQLNIYGDNVIEKVLPNDIISKMKEIYPINPDSPYVMTPRQIYTEYVLLRKVTSLERLMVIDKLSKFNKDNHYDIRLYTREKSVNAPNIRNCGPVDYYIDMPKVFNCSKINLNISLRSIRTGIPLRVLDIMAAGGFVLSNYQAEIPEYLNPDEDIVLYNDLDDLLAKTEYYLEHEEERKTIARNGKKKVLEIFDYKKQLSKMIETVWG